MKKISAFILLFFISGTSFCQYDSTGVRIKVFLQGATTGSSMQTLLNQDTLLPFQHPYNTEPWNYSGDESLDIVPSNMVDWVLVELRSRPDTIVDRRAAILLSDGSIVDTNGDAGLKFTNYTNNLYIVVYHRNHLPVMTANPVMYSNTVYYDFTDTLNYPVLGNDVIDVGGNACMIVGDVNVNKQLKYSGPGNDRAPILQKIVGETGSTSITTTINGYYTNEDVNMNGTVKYSGPGNDPSKIIQNLVNLTGSNSITSVYYSHVPDGFKKWACEDILADTRDGQQYPTVRIGNQCWMAKNLNVGNMVIDHNSGVIHSHCSDNGIIERYCYQNDVNNCAIYGGLYEWDEMMGYDSTAGVQGICPPADGWHIPSDDEWKVLEGTVDSLYGVGNSVWSQAGWRGYDAGGNLKEMGTAHWNSPNSGATNKSGFTALPGGYRYYNGSFGGSGYTIYFWSSSVFSSERAWSRILKYDKHNISRYDLIRQTGYSVRCVLDIIPPCTPQPDHSNAGPDQLNISGDSVILQANTPLYGLGVWNIVSGNGGTIADTLNPSCMFYGMPDSSYSLSWTISTQCGSSSDTAQITFAKLFECGDIINDSRDGQQYPTVQIGTQCWMAKNLNTGTFVASVNTYNNHSDVSNNGITEKYCYDNDTNNCNTYGGLYDWDEMMGYVTTEGVQGICPPTGGWHIPSDDEWKILEGTVDSQYGVGNAVWNSTGWRGSDAGSNLKEAGIVHWNSPNAGATNSSGFTALPGGYRLAYGAFLNTGHVGIFWSSSVRSSSDSWLRDMISSVQDMYRNGNYPTEGYSVRCLLN